MGIAVICLANIVTLATTLSMSAVSTNGLIEGGNLKKHTTFTNLFLYLKSQHNVINMSMNPLKGPLQKFVKTTCGIAVP